MTLLPANLALTNIAPNAGILSADHRTNYSAIQAWANALNAILGGGTSGQWLVSAGAGALAFAKAPVTGLVSSAGAIVAGTGFAASKTSTGNYSLTFSPAFAATPVLLVLPSTSIVFRGSASSASAASVETFSTAFAALDSAFGFIALAVV